MRTETEMVELILDLGTGEVPVSGMRYKLDGKQLGPRVPVDSIPERPPYKRGVDYILYYHTETGALWHKEIERPLTQEESLQVASEALEGLALEIKKKVDEIALGLSKIEDVKSAIDEVNVKVDRLGDEREKP